jgi:hypothetical protein
LVLTSAARADTAAASIAAMIKARCGMTGLLKRWFPML